VRWQLTGWMAAAVALTAADMYAVASLMPAIVGDLGIPLEHVERATPIVTVFLVGYVAALPLLAVLPGAKLRSALFVAGLAVFAAGSALTALAAGLVPLVAGRAVQGFAGGALVPLSLWAVSELFPPGRRAVAVGVLAAAQELGSLAGPVIGAGAAQALPDLGWRAIFWLDVPLGMLCGAGFFVARRALPNDGQEGGGGPDLVGAALVALALGALVVGLYPEDPVRQPVSRSFVPAAVVAAGAAAVLVIQQRGRRVSVLASAPLRQRAASGALAVNLLVGAALAAALADVPLMARTVMGLDALGSALLLGRLLLGTFAGALVGGFVTRRLGALATTLAGLSLGAAGLWFVSGFSGETLGLRHGPFTAADLPLFGAGLGFGLVATPLTTVVLDAGAGSAAAGSAAAVSSSLVVMSRTVGMLIGLAALTALGLHRFYALLGPVPRLVPGSPDFARQAFAFQARALAALTAEFTEIFRAAALVLVAAAVVTTLALAGSPRRGAGRA
jgi:MFS family permease